MQLIADSEVPRWVKGFPGLVVGIQASCVAVPCCKTLASAFIEVSNNPKLDRNVLIKLYDSTNGISWTNKTGWAGDAGTECDWYGVTCTGINVTGLNLASNNLVGTIPSEIGNFTTITSLNLSSNTLTGSIPTELGNLSNLLRSLTLIQIA